MSIGFHDNRLLIKRLPVGIDTTDQILSYDLDNLYPQRLEEIVARSGTCTKAIDRLTRFSKGQLFKDEVFNGIIINRKGLTAGKALSESALDFARNSTVAFHVMYNLLWKISSVTPIFSKYCRLGIPDEDTHKVTNIKFSTNWEEDPNKDERSGQKEVIEFDIFNPKPEEVKRQVILAGGMANYKGQIYYKNDTQDLYAKSIVDPVLDDVQAEAEVKLFTLRNLQNSFMSNYIFKYPGKPESDGHKRKIIQEINDQSGSNNAGGTMVVFDPTPDVPKNLIEKIDQQNIDKMFPETRKSAKENIIEVYGIPKPLVGFTADGGMFNDQDMFQAFKIYNAETKPDRTFLEEVYFDLFNPEVYQSYVISGRPEIKPLEWNTAEEKTTTGPEETTAPDGGLEEDKDIIDTTYNGAQITSGLEIIQKVKDGDLSETQGVAMLMEFLKIKEDKARQFIAA